MQDINNEFEKERRLSDRRVKQRRIPDKNYTGLERRISGSDRRITILNRLNVEVTDRRAFD